MTRGNVVGLIPAAGHARRLEPYCLPKELLPVAVSDDGANAPPRLRVLCEYALDQLTAAGVAEAVVVIGTHKLDMFRYLGNGARFGLDLAYVGQPTATGLPGAIDCAYAWTRGRTTALVLPDGAAEPADACSRVLAELEATGADLVLGTFPTARPDSLCPVELDAEGHVLALHDKVPGIGIPNTWGLAAWRPRFAEFLHDVLPVVGTAGSEVTLAAIMLRALTAGLDLRGVHLPEGRYVDLGTPEAIRESVFAPSPIRAISLLSSSLAEKEPA